MQQYMLLIHDQDVWETLSDDEHNAIYEEYSAFSRELRDQGRFVSAHELQPKTTAATVRVREGETLVTDGPFAETKEALGGYFLIEAESLDEATTWAARVPTARYGVVEVRPVVIQGRRSAPKRRSSASSRAASSGCDQDFLVHDVGGFPVLAYRVAEPRRRDGLAEQLTVESRRPPAVFSARSPFRSLRPAAGVSSSILRAAAREAPASCRAAASVGSPSGASWKFLLAPSGPETMSANWSR